MNSYIINDTRRPTLIPAYPNAINVNNTPYPEGTINPIHKKTITKLINIDSSFRQNYPETASTNFTWDLNKKESNVVSMRVSSVDIPVSWYSISEINGRNQFNITVHDWNTPGTSDTYLITIPPGNYFSDAFVTMLNGIFHVNDIGINSGLYYLIAEIDTNTSKTIIRTTVITDSFIPAREPFTSNPTFYFELDFFPNRAIFNPSQTIKQFQEFQRHVGWYMGFRNFDYTVTLADIVNQTLFNSSTTSLTYTCAQAGESTYSNSQSNYCFLAIDDHHNNCVCQPIISSTGESYISNNILARITVSSMPNSVLYDNGHDKIFKERVYMGPITLEKLKISLLNKYGEVIDLNGVDISLTLELTELY